MSHLTLDEINPELIKALCKLFDEYGPLGVLNTVKLMQGGVGYEPPTTRIAVQV